MEETRENADFYWNAQSSIPNVALGRGSRNSPSYLRHHSNRTPRRDSRYGLNKFQWLSSQRVLLCLILITVWAYVGFHVQSNWAHGDHRKTEFIGYNSKADSVKNHEETAKSLVSGTIFSIMKEPTQDKGKKGSESSERLAKRLPRKRVRRMLRRVKPKASMEENSDSEFEDVDIPTKNSSFGLKVGPFNEIEDRIIGLSLQNRKGKCIREEEFASLVWTRSFVLIFHELSMTGAPLSMMELSAEILNCGGNVKVVTLSKKGGLMWELARRGIEVIEDKGEISFKAAMKADLVIAGSAVSSSWIEQYLRQNPAGSNQLVWWIMENRREYFNRSKLMLSTVNTVAFLSNVQSKQWLSWCEEDKIKLKTQPVLVPLSVNDDLAFLAGIPCSLNTPILNVNKMMEKRDLLRSEVREKMGLSDNDMLVLTLSSINPTKGQLLLLEAVRLVAERNVSQRYPMLDTNILSLSNQKNASIKSVPHVEEALHLNQTYKQAENMHQLNSKKRLKESSRSTSNVSFMHQLNSKKTLKISSRSMNNVSLSSQAKDSQQNWPKVKNLLSEPFVSKELNLKVLIGSVGSKSNKAPYVKSLLRFLSQRSNMSSLVLWTRTTARVASLYAAADVYVINAQGVGETFGRVTIEAMAFGLPVLGTDAGGTKEIVEDKRTGLLHPVGHEGAAALAKNIQHLMDNPLARTSMGMRGRQKVQEAFLKHHTYSRMAKAIANCLKARH